MKYLDEHPTATSHEEYPPRYWDIIRKVHKGMEENISEIKEKGNRLARTSSITGSRERVVDNILRRKMIPDVVSGLFPSS